MTERRDDEKGAAAPQAMDFPRLSPLGLDGMLAVFADRLDESSNRAALAFAAAMRDADRPEVVEISSAPASVLVRFDPHSDVAALSARLESLLESRDWTQAPPAGPRRLWRIPAAFDGAELAEAAELAGMSEAKAVEALCAARLRVLAIGFAPGQPYLGPLGPEWDIPRRSDLIPKTQVGDLTLAAAQLTLFAAETPTGWRRVARTAFRPFRPGGDDPFPLRPGDEVTFPRVSADELEGLRDDPAGGARSEAIA